MFLAKSSNLFPAIELTRRLQEVRENHLYELTQKKVRLSFNPNGQYNGVDYVVDDELNAIDEFP